MSPDEASQVTLKPHFLNDARDDGGVSRVDGSEKSTTKVKTFPGYGTLETSNHYRGGDIDQYHKLLTKAPYTTPRLNGSDNSKRKKMGSTLRIATTTLVRHRTHHPWRRQRRRQHRPPTQLPLRRRCKKRLYDGFPVQRSCDKLRFARCGRRHEFRLYEGLARGGGFAEGGFGDRVADCRDGAVGLLCDGLCLCVEGWVVRVDVGVAGHFLRGGGHRWQLERDGVL